MNQELSVLRAVEIQAEPGRKPWLIHSLWSRNAAGILGGPPKCCKTWLGLDMALSVASNTPCLGRFPVEQPGPTLIYMAEDALPAVRERIQALCRHRNIDLAALDLYVIDAPSLRLDTAQDQKRLIQAIEQIKPRLLLLDPLVRIHQSDENSAMDMSRLLGFFRGLQRSFSIAVVLVHHTSKKSRPQPGQALRGSSDLHAWTDSSAYLVRKMGGFLLTVEHRSQSAPQPMLLNLVADPAHNSVHLQLASHTPHRLQTSEHVAFSSHLLELILHADAPLTRTQIRNTLKVKNQTLGHALAQLESNGRIRRSPQGWIPLLNEKQNHSLSQNHPDQDCLSFDPFG